jgi:acyl carrier protein
MNQIQDKLLELIQRKTGFVPALDDSFDALKIDSLAMAELTVEIEKVFDIRVREDITDVNSIRELVAYVESKTDSSGVS